MYDQTDSFLCLLRHCFDMVVFPPPPSFSVVKGVESFLHKDVSFVVTGNQECLNKQRDTDTKAPVMGKSEEAQHPIMSRERRPGTPRPAVNNNNNNNYY